MASRPASAARHAFKICIAGASLALLFAVQPAAAADTFAALDGAWSGKGHARFSHGATEALSCTARYAGHGSNLTLFVRCASASAHIHLTGSLTAKGDAISGGWSESAFGLSGTAEGAISGPSIKLRITGGATGELRLAVAGNRHTLTLSAQGSALRDVNVSLMKR